MSASAPDSGWQRIRAAALRLLQERSFAQVSLVDVAHEAGVSRATIYNRCASLEQLYCDIATEMMLVMNQRIDANFLPADEPDARLALGIRWYIRRAHEDPLWYDLVSRYGRSPRLATRVWRDPVLERVLNALAREHDGLATSGMRIAPVFVSSSVLAAMFMVRSGRSSWQDAGTESSVTTLLALGVPYQRAWRIGRTDLRQLKAGH